MRPIRARHRFRRTAPQFERGKTPRAALAGLGGGEKRTPTATGSRRAAKGSPADGLGLIEIEAALELRRAGEKASRSC